MEGVKKIRERQRQRSMGVPVKEWAKSSDREAPADAVDHNFRTRLTQEQADAANKFAESLLTNQPVPDGFGQGLDELAAEDRSASSRDDWGYRRYHDKRYGYSGEDANSEEATRDAEPSAYPDEYQPHDPKRHAIDKDMSFEEYLDKKRHGIAIERRGGGPRRVGEASPEVTRDSEPSAYADPEFQGKQAEVQSREQLEAEVRRLRAELSEALTRGDGAEKERNTDAETRAAPTTPQPGLRRKRKNRRGGQAR